jgi:hypothetical protein
MVNARRQLPGTDFQGKICALQDKNAHLSIKTSSLDNGSESIFYAAMKAF